jgi:transcriptional regulator with XRE-family HTH domain
MIDYASIGRRIALNRKKVRVTQADLAEHLGVSESFISQIERGKAKISLPRLYQIAEFLDMDIALLVSDCAKMSSSEINSEIELIIKDWAPEHRSILIDLIICADQKIKSN